jgi:hypothetical protein
MRKQRRKRVCTTMSFICTPQLILFGYSNKGQLARRARGTYEKEQRFIQGFEVVPDGMTPLGMHTHGREDNLGMHLQEIRLVGGGELGLD